VTLVSWGAAVARTLAAAERLGAEGVSVEVIDLRSLSPLDEATVLRSIAKTGRLVIVHDAVAPFGGGAEVAAVAACLGFASLKAPVLRITPPFAPPPLPDALQTAYYPQAEDIATRTLDLLSGRTTPEASPATRT
jgi:pyruvate/2-oxoglutarate/acetoin dehydrogenase E1 component